ncbi:MAG: molybdopterin-dependent oxidoreductase [Rubrivivax sp.]|nr:molybdopterin-dependent oxidoreductase [Rubrivivax sp.]
MESPRTSYRICPLCEACCGLEITTRGREVVAIRGAPNDVLSRGYLCPKGYALKDLHEDPDRLRQPLVRRGGTLQPATWEEAFEAIARGLQPVIEQHGRDAVALTFGNPAAHKMGLLLYTGRLAKALGSRNVFSASTLDQMPKQLANGWMFGHWLTMPIPDIARTDWLLVIGANPMASNGSLWCVPDFRGHAKALRQRGGKLVVIDPRRTETAAIADEHHAIRPGGDVVLLAAMVHVLFAEGLVKLGRLEGLLDGVDAVRSAVTPYTPEAAAARCGVDPETIRRLARELAAAPRAAVYGRIGTCVQRWGTVNSWLVEVLNALTGHLDEPGGAMFAKAAAFADNTVGPPGRGRGIVTGRHASRVSGAPEVWGELPMTCLAEEMETPGEGQVRALISVASNPVLSAPGGPRIARALERLDFMVSLDIYVNETTRHADVILPGQSPLELLHYDTAFPQFSWRNQARASAPVFEPDPAHVPEWLQLTTLGVIVSGRGSTPAQALQVDDEALEVELQRVTGSGAQAEAARAAMQAQGLRGAEARLELALRSGPWGDGFGVRPEGLTLERVLATSGGIDLGELQPRLPEALRTPCGRVELAPPVCLQELQRAQEELHAVQPELVVIGRRDVRSNNSWMHNLPVLAKGRERCTLLVHPSDAASRGLADGAMATIAGAGAALPVRVEVSDAMRPGVVCLPHGWGHGEPGVQLGVAAQRPGVNLNALLPDDVRDAPSGNAVLNGVAVTLVAMPAVAALAAAD